jgi:hypothetical protein
MNSAIIVAAGIGKRMGANVDKLWLEVAGRPVVAHTWKQFNDAACVDEIILVVRDGMQTEFQKLAAKFNFKKTFRLVIGGADTLVRPYFIARGAQLPFLLTMLGVLGGALAFGLLGIFLGPVLLGVGYALVNEWADREVRPLP